MGLFPVEGEESFLGVPLKHDILLLIINQIEINPFKYFYDAGSNRYYTATPIATS